MDMEKQLQTPVESFNINPSHWSENGIELSLASIDRLQRSLLSTVQLILDTPAEDPLSLSVIRCLDGLQRFHEGILLTKESLDLNFSHTYIDNIPLSLIERQYLRAIEESLLCMQEQDRDRLVDLLEGELLTLLSSWKMGLILIKAARRRD